MHHIKIGCTGQVSEKQKTSIFKAKVLEVWRSLLKRRETLLPRRPKGHTRLQSLTFQRASTSQDSGENPNTGIISNAHEFCPMFLQPSEEENSQRGRNELVFEVALLKAPRVVICQLTCHLLHWSALRAGVARRSVSVIRVMCWGLDSRGIRASFHCKVRPFCSSPVSALIMGPIQLSAPRVTSAILSG
jgi:hypothetical protein